MRVLLTGAATGIGAATVEKFKDQGCHVTAFDIQEPANVDRWLSVDLTDVAAVKTACDQVDGPFDVLINNAGLPPRDDNQLDVLTVNFLSLRTVTETLLPKLADGARIINTASRAGMMWQDNIAEVKALFEVKDEEALKSFIADRNIDATRAYNLSKEAVIVYTKAITKSLLKRNIRANSVSPAPVATGILDDFLTAFGEKAVAALSKAGRAGEPEDIARVMSMLASEDSGWIKGEDVMVDGGLSAMITCETLGIELAS